MKWSQFPFGLFKTNSNLQNTVKPESDIAASGATWWRGFYCAARQACVCISVHQNDPAAKLDVSFFYCIFLKMFVFTLICCYWRSQCDRCPGSQVAAVITGSAHCEICSDFQFQFLHIHARLHQHTRTRAEL